MKESEARKKWCPFILGETVKKTRPHYDDEGYDYYQCKCQGSDCMAWTWNVDKQKQYSTTNGYCQRLAKGNN